LSSLSASELQEAIINGDVLIIKSIKGIGLKTAERIILELKDKIKNKDFVDNSSKFSPDLNNSLRNDALKALSSLGISKSLASIKVDQILKEKEDLSLEDLIKDVLKKS